ncbi:MAG TPA: sugar MFS transporter [Mucilaginibacter sp.]|jgi:FHS family L-fucose permease-like MFS transporter|nr:sugar MFS transporter [Mucilaginibacter sp.]
MAQETIISNPTESTVGNITTSKKSLGPVYIIGILFFVFGFITWTNSVLIPYFKIACQLNNKEAYLVATAFYIAYLVMAIPSAILLKKTGFKNGMSVGLLIMAVGAVIFIPAALTRQYAVFLTGLFIQGTGLAVLQTASNPYITIVGPIESAAKRISIMGIFNKAAGALAPIILGSIILKDADALKIRIKNMSAAAKATELDTLAHQVILPYIVIMIVLILLAIFVFYSTLPEIETEKDGDSVANQDKKTSVFQFPHLMIGVLALFAYVGVEVLAGDSIVSYGASQGISLSTSKFFTACTLSGMIIGYIIGIICIPKYVKQDKALTVSAVLGVIFSIMAITTHGYTSVFCIALLGLANSLMWPALWPLSIKGLGSFTKIGSSLLIMGIAGGSLIPLLYGYVADLSSLRQAYIIMIPCYIIIGYFSVWGHKLKAKSSL